MTPGERERYLDLGSLTLRVVEAGPEGGPLVVLLHGFPEFSYGWRHQIRPLAEAGFHVLVPDQRGYNTSGKPRKVADYRIEILAGDVLRLIEAYGGERASVVGHDWGAIPAWWLGSHHPERLERLAILNVPHPLVMRRHLLTDSAQIRKSWYIFFFQLPLVPDWLMRRDGFRFAKAVLRSTSRPGTFSDEDLERYVEAWSQPGALRSMIHWYRAGLRYAFRPYGPARVPVETLVLWGPRDFFLSSAMAEESLGFCGNGRLVWLEGASHWVQHEEAASVNEFLLRFLRRGLAGVPGFEGAS